MSDDAVKRPDLKSEAEFQSVLVQHAAHAVKLTQSLARVINSKRAHPFAVYLALAETLARTIAEIPPPVRPELRIRLLEKLEQAFRSKK